MKIHLHNILALLIFSTLLAFSPAKAEELCGGMDAEVCLTNSLTVIFEAPINMGPGTALILRVPGMEIDDDLSISGAPDQPYRLSAQGSVSDNVGSVWGTVTGLAQDSDGLTVLGFLLESGTTAAGTTIQLSINNIEVCQMVSDGPREVNIGVSLFFNTNNGGFKQGYQSMKRMNEFQSCSLYSGNLPVTADQLLVLFNPHETAVAGTLGEQPFVLQPHTRVVFDGSAGLPALEVQSGLNLSIAIYEKDEDIQVTGLQPGNNNGWVFPHTAQDLASWQNTLHFVNPESMTLTSLTNTEVAEEDFSAGNHTKNSTLVDDRGSWLKLSASQSGMNIFLAFGRRDTGSSAWVSGIRVENFSSIGAQTIYLPHVAEDLQSFWTGYAVSNANAQTAEVEAFAHAADGSVMVSESFILSAGQTRLGLIGQDLFQNREGIAYVVFKADNPIIGTELLGTVQNDRGYFSGLTMPWETKDLHGFPWLKADGSDWSGIVVINQDPDASPAILRFYDEGGNLLAEETTSAVFGVRETFLAPANAVSAVLTGTKRLAFAVVGDNEGRIGSYR